MLRLPDPCKITASTIGICSTDFSKLAEAAGILGLRAESPKVKTLPSQALEHEGPALVDVTVNRQ
jgi:thiamine pyrophosphate-dependent acetolactate synthase large subunit-like protein